MEFLNNLSIANSKEPRTLIEIMGTKEKKKRNRNHKIKPEPRYFIEILLIVMCCSIAIGMVDLPFISYILRAREGPI